MPGFQDILPRKTHWKRCSTCKREIPFGGIYHLCSVSTCRRKTTGLVFCTVSCWDAHLGFANHRSAYAEEASAPTYQSYVNDNPKRSLQERTGGHSEKRIKRVLRPSKNSNSPSAAQAAPSIDTDTLVVVSKVKNLIRDQSDFNTSQCAIDALTNKVVDACLKAISHARASERKTVMGRDIV